MYYYSFKDGKDFDNREEIWFRLAYFRPNITYCHQVGHNGPKHCTHWDKDMRHNNVTVSIQAINLFNSDFSSLSFCSVFYFYIIYASRREYYKKTWYQHPLLNNWWYVTVFVNASRQNIPGPTLNILKKNPDKTGLWNHFRWRHHGLQIHSQASGILHLCKIDN